MDAQAETVSEQPRTSTAHPHSANDAPPGYLLESGRPAPGAGQPGAPSEQRPSAAEAARPAVLELIEAATGAGDDRPEDLVATLESLLFVAEDPPTVRQLAEATNVSKDAVEEALEQLQSRAGSRGICLQRVGSKVRLVSAPESAKWVERFLGLDRPNRLSKASLETLAIVAYRQPITRADLEKVRGVSCDGPFQTLRSRDLIESVGELDAPGRPHLWAVTDRFLDHFGLRSLSELPPLPMLSQPPAQQGKLPQDQPGSGASDQPAAAATVEPSGRAAPAGQPAPDVDPSGERAGDASPAPLPSPEQFAAAGGSGD